MAKITREQIIKINDKCDNGFKLDVECVLIHGEKKLYKDITIDENTKIEFKLQYYKELETITNSNNVTYRKETGNLIPTLTFRKWSRRDSESLWTSTDWGKEKEAASDRPTRKNISLLQKLTKNYNDDILKAIIKEFYGDLIEEQEEDKINDLSVEVENMERSAIIPNNIDKEDRCLYLRKALGKREVVRQTIYSYLSGKTSQEIKNNCSWLSLVCEIHNEELTMEYIKDILKFGDYGTRLGDSIVTTEIKEEFYTDSRICTTCKGSLVLGEFGSGEDAKIEPCTLCDNGIQYKINTVCSCCGVDDFTWSKENKKINNYKCFDCKFPISEDDQQETTKENNIEVVPGVKPGATNHDTDKEKLQRFLNLTDKEKLTIVKNALDMTFKNMYYNYDPLVTCYNYVGELFNNEYTNVLNGQRGLYTFKEVFDIKIFYELQENDFIIDSDNYNKILYDIIYSIVNQMLLKNYFDKVVPSVEPGAATQETNLNMSLQLLAAEPTQTHFKRHGFRNWLKLIHEDNKNYSVEIQDVKDGYLLQIQIYEEKHEGYNKIINREYKQYKEPNILNILEDVKKTVEGYLKEHLSICINIDISFIETYYIPFKKLTEIDKHLYKFKMLDGSYKTLEVEDLDTVEDYYKKGIDLKETLKEIYNHIAKVEDIFNKLYGHTNIIDLFKFIHDNNYKQNFRESFIKFIEEAQPCSN